MDIFFNVRRAARIALMLPVLALWFAGHAHAAILRPIGLDAFSDRTIVESFEGLMPGENIEAVPLSDVYTDDGRRRSGLDGDGFLRPGVDGPFVLKSGITMSAWRSHTEERARDGFIGDFSLGDASFFGVRSHIFDSVDDVPDGTAYLAVHGSDIRFDLPWNAHRFGVMTRPLGLRLFDENGDLLFQGQMRLDDFTDPLKAFEFDLPFRSVVLYYPGGSRVDGADRYIMDFLIADPLPEPASLLLFAGVLGMTGRALSPRASSVIIPPCPHRTRRSTSSTATPRSSAPTTPSAGG